MRHLFNDQLGKQAAAQGYDKLGMGKPFKVEEPPTTIPPGDRQRDIDMLLAVVEAQRQVIEANRRELTAKELYIKHGMLDPVHNRIVHADAARPKPFYLVAEEGETWQRSHLWNSRISVLRPHAIIFEDGSVFDMHNGWRSNTSPETVECIKEKLGL